MRSRGHHRRRTFIAGIVTVALMAVPLAALAAAPTTFADHFKSRSYSLNSGLSDWATDWIEAGESDGPNEGYIQVSGRNPCALDLCLDLIDTAGPSVSVARTADLSGYSTATVGFTYQRHLHSGGGTGSVQLQVRADGGSWATLRTYSYAVEDTSPQPELVDISGYISSATSIRFAITGGGSSHHLMADFVTIAASGNPPTTTTTTAPTTTTTTAPTTTTTTAPTGTTEPGPDTTTVVATPPPPTPPPPDAATATTIPLTPEEAAVVALNTPALDLGARYVNASAAPGGVAAATDPAAGGQAFLDVPALGGLLAGFSTAVEGVAGSLVPSAILAIVVAWLSVRGLDVVGRRRPPKRRPTPGL